MSQVEFLLMFPGVINYSDTGNKIDNLLGRGVVQVVATLMSSVAIDPLQPQVIIWSCSVSHVLFIYLSSDAT